MSATTVSSKAQVQQLRPPFRFVYNASSKVSSTINYTIDGTLSIFGKSTKAFMNNSLVVSATKSLKRIEENVEGKVPCLLSTNEFIS